MDQSSGIRGRWIVGALCTLAALLLTVAPVQGASLSSLDSDPGIEQTEVSPQDLAEIEQEEEAQDEEIQQDIEAIQSQIQDDLEVLQTATSEATSAVSDLLEQSQRATQLTARETWDEFLDQLMRWKVQAQLRTRQHIQSTRHLLKSVGQNLSQTFEDDQSPSGQGALSPEDTVQTLSDPSEPTAESQSMTPTLKSAPKLG